MCNCLRGTTRVRAAARVPLLATPRASRRKPEAADHGHERAAGSLRSAVHSRQRHAPPHVHRSLRDLHGRATGEPRDAVRACGVRRDSDHHVRVSYRSAPHARPGPPRVQPARARFAPLFAFGSGIQCVLHCCAVACAMCLVFIHDHDQARLALSVWPCRAHYTI